MSGSDELHVLLPKLHQERCTLRSVPDPDHWFHNYCEHKSLRVNVISLQPLVWHDYIWNECMVPPAETNSSEIKCSRISARPPTGATRHGLGRRARVAVVVSSPFRFRVHIQAN